MRLDEWQKFIESQFLEETTPVPVPVKPAVLPSPEPQTTLALDDQAPLTLSPTQGAETTAPLQAPEAADISVPELELPTERVPPRLQPTPTTPRQTGFVVRSVVESPADVPAPLPPVSPVPFETTLDLDADIPVFADYLPTKSGEHSNILPAPDAITTLLADDAASGPVSVLLPLTSGFLPAKTVPKLPSGSDSAESPADRRRTRAPYARNIQAENGNSGLSSADLWSQVPRHVQTLLAMERREEEREVAQSSYKRPFQEKRAELIARILDPVLSLEDTARLLNVCPTTVRRYTNKGILTHYRKEPERPSANTTERETRQRRFRLSDILTFLETQQTALESDRLQERVAPSRRNRVTTPLEPAGQE